MNFNHPDFLASNPPRSANDPRLAPRGSTAPDPQASAANNAPFVTRHDPNFDTLLRHNLAALEEQQDILSPVDARFAASPRAPPSTGHGPFGPSIYQNFDFLDLPNLALGESGAFDSFHLPRELQGGIGNISSRRPSYAAESFTRNSPSFPPVGAKPSTKNSLASFAAANNFSMSKGSGFDQLADSLGNMSLTSNLSDFQARRPSQLADYPPLELQQPDFLALYNSPLQYSQGLPFSTPQMPSPMNGPLLHGMGSINTQSYTGQGSQAQVRLDNKLMLHDQHILATPELKNLFSMVTRYFQDKALSNDILTKLKTLLTNPVVIKLVNFIKNLNNLTYNHKMLCLSINKNGKLDLLSYPNNSNVYLQHDDLVIVDGDRGKDLVMILDPLVQLDLAILFNFLKKIEHLKSLTISDNNGGSSVKSNHCGGTHSTALNASAIVNSHSTEDNEFIISLPTKQVLRFATPKEVQKLSGKFLEEKKAFITCYNKIKELGLSNNLKLINVEYQSDFKKLIFYYFAKFKRIDFRGLIKELFKIYKTRIWLCAVLPYDRPELYTKGTCVSGQVEFTGGIPAEYELSNEQITNFSIAEFASLALPNYFHLRNMLNLLNNLMEDVKGNFYGFNSGESRVFPGDERRKSYLIQPSFDPFKSDKFNG